MSDGWKKVGDFEKRETVDLKRDGIGTVTEGIYEGRKENAGIRKDSTVYNILVDGVKSIFWGSAVLDGRFNEIPEGSEVRIVYKGLEASKTKGHNAMHVYDVFYREPGDHNDEEKTETGSEDDIPF